MKPCSHDWVTALDFKGAICTRCSKELLEDPKLTPAQIAVFAVLCLTSFTVGLVLGSMRV